MSPLTSSFSILILLNYVFRFLLSLCFNLTLPRVQNDRKLNSQRAMKASMWITLSSQILSAVSDTWKWITPNICTHARTHTCKFNISTEPYILNCIPLYFTFHSLFYRHTHTCMHACTHKHTLTLWPCAWYNMHTTIWLSAYSIVLFIWSELIWW